MARMRHEMFALLQARCSVAAAFSRRSSCVRTMPLLSQMHRCQQQQSASPLYCGKYTSEKSVPTGSTTRTAKIRFLYSDRQLKLLQLWAPF